MSAERNRRTIALLTDFGERDYYVGAVKGVILSINPEARIVDISHEIRGGDILEGAFVLLNASMTFPAGTIFLAVVDPGVGTQRKCVVMQTKNRLCFVAPDNGLLTLVAEVYGVEEVREIKNPEFLRQEISPTFHGRDILAPVAAWLSKGIEISLVGPKTGYTKLEIPQAELTGRRITGSILHIDRFGNLVTNIPQRIVSFPLGQSLLVEFKTVRFAARFLRTFGDAQPGDKLAYIGSAGLLELAKNLGNLASEIRAKPLSSFSITPMPVRPEYVEGYLKQGYRIVGTNSAVKICHWTKNSLLGGTSCYKSKFYGISSWRCLQMTPSLFNCSQRCLFCWRMVEATCRETLPPDDPVEIIERSIQAQRELLSGFKGNPKVDPKRWQESQDPKHAAISLAGEPTMYDRLSELLTEFKRRNFTTFVVSNGTFPEKLQALSEEPTQLYITVAAPEEEIYRKLCRPLLPDGWSRLLRSLELLNSFSCRKVIRLTLVKEFNMCKPQLYADLIEKSNPDFVEAKAYMHVGFSRNRLQMTNMPSHNDVLEFAQEISRHCGYKIVDQSTESRVVLMKK